MTNTLYKLGTAIASGAVLLGTISPLASAATTITIGQNGAFSNNTVTLNKTNTTTVTQNNVADIDNDIDLGANTGNNTAGFNTGGDVQITTGNATTNATVNNTVNSNVAHVDPCGGCPADNATLKIVGNGALSTNTIDANLASTTVVSQNNDAEVDNDIDAYAGTGDNLADFNTGGSVLIRTGNASTNATANTKANSNVAVVGGSGSGNGGGLVLKIIENGAFSDNLIGANVTSTTVLSQNNVADIDNDFDLYADTGDNTAFANTGASILSDPSIITGDAMVNASVKNNVNANFAFLADCCPDDVLVDVVGNGASALGSADNTVNLNLANTSVAAQDNDFDCAGSSACLDLDAYAGTGDNLADFNTTGDTGIDTGNATNNASVENKGNTNQLTMGDTTPSLPLPGSWSSAWLAFWAHWGM